MSATFIPPPAAPAAVSSVSPSSGQILKLAEIRFISQFQLPNQTQLSNLRSLPVPPPYALRLDPMQAPLVYLHCIFSYDTLGR